MRESVPCTLSGTRTCAVMNMHSCDSCPCNSGDGKNDELVKDVEMFCDLIPEEGLYSLFDTGECQLCKGEEKGKTSSYALLDMAHKGPEHMHRKWKLFSRETVGFLAPVQFAVCKRCRRKLVALEYIPILMTVLFTIVSLLLVANEDQRRALAGTAIGFGLPLLIVLGCIIVGYVAGRILKLILQNKWQKGTYVNALEHPFIVKMMERGWFPLFNAKKGKVIFTRKLIDRGLGTATKDAYETLDNEENN